ncbi:hypothetical protein [Sulfurirhabdus autotrophica]|uniref:Glycosyl transferase family 2 n=1 Tax=Sulfurirhabdus autotrophica TaxID=1706046 RepID=A0A4R3Y757_9PROT|nr:hypothetical protein [Sulfurirhabdus autotrophica]TCV88115.1 hypothetical protein EDC63_10472 [Sulfurirhabdus autotrophica]
MFYSLKDKLRRKWFASQCKGILKTPPVTLERNCNLAVLSQLQHKDVLMFLLALKSFAREVPIGHVYLLNDGSLTESDINLLQAHIPELSFFELKDFQGTSCPRRGCWERLLAIAELVKKYYVIQLDSDTLTIGAMPELVECVKQGIAFTIGTWDNQTIETMEERCTTAKTRTPDASSHVQLMAEASLDKLKSYKTLHYVRGCAGFAGFPQNSFTKDFVEGISNEMHAAIGSKWSEWGSEQVMSNIVVANIANASVLPHPKYSDCKKMKLPQTVFIHFIGSCRFNTGVYANLGINIIKQLN